MKLTHKEGTNSITEALGISADRTTELSKFVDDYSQNHPDTVSDGLSQIAEKCNTPEELAWVVYATTTNIDAEMTNDIFSGAGEPAFAGGADEDTEGDFPDAV
jgi:hypothetical protein